MAGNISKNARRGGAQELISKWGGKIVMRSVFENGKMKHFAECQETHNTALRPKDLVDPRAGKINQQRLL